MKKQGEHNCMKKGKYSYVTYLGTESYLAGVLALNRCLKKVKSKYPLTVLINENISRNSKEKIRRYGLRIIEIRRINIPSRITNNNSKVNQKQWTDTFSKLYTFGLTIFDKVVFLDADLYVRQNIDELFSCDLLSAVAAGKSYPGNEKWNNINSGVMVIIPKEGEERRLISLINQSSSNRGLGDQDIIQVAYNKNKINYLSEAYNILAGYEPFYLSKKIEYGDIKIIHYTGYLKPWNMSFLDKLKIIAKYIYESVTSKSTIKGITLSIYDFLNYLKMCKD